MKSSHLLFRLGCFIAALITLQGCFYIPEANYEEYDYRRAYDDDKPLRGPGSRLIPPPERLPENAAVSAMPKVHRRGDPILYFDELISEIAREYKIDYHLLLAIGQVESSGNPKAVSHADCHGLTQLKLSTARDYAPRVTRSDLHDPQINLEIAGRHMVFLRRLVRKRFPNADAERRIILLAAAWNAGWGNVLQANGVSQL